MGKIVNNIQFKYPIPSANNAIIQNHALRYLAITYKNMKWSFS
jgi:hypothetical protein